MNKPIKLGPPRWRRRLGKKLRTLVFKIDPSHPYLEQNEDGSFSVRLGQYGIAYLNIGPGIVHDARSGGIWQHGKRQGS